MLEQIRGSALWERVFYVVAGGLLVYLSLTQDTGRFNLWYGKVG